MRRRAVRNIVNLVAGAAFASLCWVGIAAAASQPIKVDMNHARILKLSRPVEKVIIGNSNIADVTVADPKTIVLTGKAFGTTNLVLLDKDGGAIVDKDVLVGIDEDHTVRVYRQTERTVLSCGPYCEIQADAAAKAP
ncbi:MAG TPA: pilus assembly protein N-terminal domain-containing protein [Pararhizobium sp.]|nr:pilus assembly protein N-terminal domain-containing protein [Pararhizobium sp.]